MIFQLREGNGETVCDVEVFGTGRSADNFGNIELTSSVFVRGFAMLYDRAPNSVDDLEDIQELRRWLWEEHFMGRKNEYSIDEYKTVTRLIRERLKVLAEKYSLYLYED